jgi:hypothetical protein
MLPLAHEADWMEELVGGRRYEVVALPDALMDTTLFVGNLCEFVKDDDLSGLFQSVSLLHSLPACVARKPDTTSLQYGFVVFPTRQEKEVSDASVYVIFVVQVSCLLLVARCSS